MRNSLKCAPAIIAGALALTSCRGPEVDKPPAIPNSAIDGKSATSQPAPLPAVPPVPTTLTPKLAIVDTEPGTIYVCVTETAGQTRQTAIAFSADVAAVCRKAPEMGPCQYERAACRRIGGRVFTVDGTEITPQTEAEYDKRVLRVRMKSN
jgi:hypothetical protein